MLLRNMSGPAADPGRRFERQKIGHPRLRRRQPRALRRRSYPDLRLGGHGPERRRRQLRLAGPLGERTSNPVRDIFAYDRTHESDHPGLTAQRRDRRGGQRELEPAGDLGRRPLRRLRDRSRATSIPASDRSYGGVYVRDLKAQDDDPRLRADGARGETARGLRTVALHGGGQKVGFVWSVGHRLGHRARNVISVRDSRRRQDAARLAGRGRRGAIANQDCSEPSISANGRYVAFASKATNLVHGDDHQVEDVFVRDLKTGRTTLVSRARRRPRRGRAAATPRVPRSPPTAATSPSSPTPATSGPTTTAAVTDVFVKDMRTGRVYLASRAPRAAAGQRARRPAPRSRPTAATSPSTRRRRI